MKKLVFFLILAALIAFPGCSFGNNPIDTEDQSRVEAPDDPDTQKRPPLSSDSDEDTDEDSKVSTDSPETSKKTDTDTKKPVNDDLDISGQETSKKADTTTAAEKTTTANKEVTPSVPMEYRLEYKVDNGRYLLDADYNLAYVKDGDDPVFHKSSRTKLLDKRTSIYCSDLNKSLLLDEDGKAISVVSGRLEMPYDNFLIAYKSASSADFRICDISDGSILIDTLYSGFNECKISDEDEVPNVSLLLGTKQIHIFDGSEIIFSRQYEAIYYYVTTYALVRENGHLRLYDTDFELLADFGEITASNKMHFSETIFDGKDSFEFFFDSGSFKYEPAPEDDDSEDTTTDDTTAQTSAPESHETSAPHTPDVSNAPDTSDKEPDDTKNPDTSSAPSTSKPIEDDTTKPSEPTTTESTGTNSDDDDELVTVAKADGVSLIETGGSYFLCTEDRVMYVAGIKEPLYAEILLSDINLICVLNKDLSVEAYMFTERSVEELEVGMTETEVYDDITIINGSVRSYALKDGELLLSCSGGFAVTGNWLLGYDMIADGMFAYTTEGRLIVAPENAVGVSPLDDGRLLVAQKNRFLVYNANCKLGFLSPTYDQVFMTVNDIFLVNDSNSLSLIDTDGAALAVIADLSDWKNMRLVKNQSGYDGGELIGSEVYFFAFEGYKNGVYSTVEFSFFPETGKVNATYDIDIDG